MSTPSRQEVQVAVVGAGVVGSAVALALARRGVSVAVFEALSEPGLCASGTNSGILHTGFDSVPGSVETECILESARVRDGVLDELGVPVLRCGAVMRGRFTALNGVVVRELDDGSLEIPGEAVTDPVAYTVALAQAAVRHGAAFRVGARVGGLEEGWVHLAGGSRVGCRLVVNCAGLYADVVARMAGDESFSIYPRKGEFFVFDAPPPARILLPVPSPQTKGVLVFPTLDGKTVAGPTAVDLSDKEDWSVRPESFVEVAAKAVAMYPPLEGLEPVAAYAGLRPAGTDGANYVIGRSRACPWLVNVAAIRSTGLSASLGIAARVVSIVGSSGVTLRAQQPLLGGPPPALAGPWWRRSAEFRAAAA